MRPVFSKAYKQIAVLSALLLAGLQGFALFHGAEYGFKPHAHGHLGFGEAHEHSDHVSDAVADAHVLVETPSSDGSSFNCDILVYLDAQSRPTDSSSFTFSFGFLHLLAFPERASEFVEQGYFPVAPRAPPVRLHI